MAKYTIELRKIQAEFYNAMQDYPIFDEAYREGLNDKIYHACKMREIGYETVEMFIEQLKEWMDVHMPEFNRQYLANAVELTPLQRANIIERFTQATHKVDDNDGTYSDYRNMRIDDSTYATDDTTVRGQKTDVSQSQENIQNEQQTTDQETTESQSEDNSHGYVSDFPQDELENPADSKYYTTGQNAHAENQGEVNREANSETESNQQTNRSGTDSSTSQDTSQSRTSRDRDYIEATTKSGSNANKLTHNGTNNYTRERTGTPAYSDFELLEQYRKSFVNVDNLIIRGLKKELFMNIW